MLDAVNSFRPLQMQAPSSGNVPSGSAGGAASAGGGEQSNYLPNLRRDPIPEYDHFVKSTNAVTSAKATSGVEKASGVSSTNLVNNVNPKADISSWVQSVKKLLPFQQTQKVEKTQKPELPALNDAVKKLPVAGNAESPFARAAEKVATKSQGANPFSTAKQNNVPKSGGGSDFSAALSAGGVSMLTMPVAGPAALVAKPGLAGQIATGVSAITP